MCYVCYYLLFPRFKRIQIQRNQCGERDVTFSVKFCGICHTDLSLPVSHFPCVPGHELAGVVAQVFLHRLLLHTLLGLLLRPMFASHTRFCLLQVGSEVRDIKVGDHVGCGFISDCCMDCSSCRFYSPLLASASQYPTPPPDPSFSFQFCLFYSKNKFLQ